MAIDRWVRTEFDGYSIRFRPFSCAKQVRRVQELLLCFINVMSASSEFEILDCRGAEPYFFNAPVQFKTTFETGSRRHEGIGVRTLWVDGGVTVEHCQDGSLHVTVMLLSHDIAQKKISAEGIPDHVFGQAHLPSRRRLHLLTESRKHPAPPRHPRSHSATSSPTKWVA